MIKILSSKTYKELKKKADDFDLISDVSLKEIPYERLSTDRKDLIIKRLVYANKTILKMAREVRELRGIAC